MKAQGAVEVQPFSLFTLSASWGWGRDGQYHAPATWPLGKRSCTQSTGGRVGPRASMDRCGKSCSHWHSIPKL